MGDCNCFHFYQFTNGFKHFIGICCGIGIHQCLVLTFPHMAMYKPVMISWLSIPVYSYHEVFINQALQGAPINSSLQSLLILNLFLLLPFFFLKRT
jgi:hypothetical protein